MKLGLYAVYDQCSAVYDGPMPVQTEALASRGFSDMALNADHPIGKHPEHYALIKVGEWNDAEGEVIPCQKITVCTALECVAAAQVVDQGEQKALLKEVQ